MERVKIVKHPNKVAEVILNRPDKMNALDMPMFDAIIKAGEELNQDKSIRAIVLRGEGHVFCAGMDTANFNMDPNSEVNKTDLEERTFGIANKFQKVGWVWRECQVPVIAAVEKVAFGGGLQIMLGADIKYIHPATQLSIMEMKWGLIPDMAGTQLMRQQIRLDIFKELTFTNRLFTAQEAVAYGFATHLSDDPIKAAIDMANEIATKSPSAIVQAKHVLNKAVYLNEADGLMLESKAQKAIIKQHNQVEAIFAAMQKRNGDFKDYRF